VRQLFRRRLLAWYRRNGRDLPWRRTTDPYHILVSEVMLQQTQVDRVLPKYHEWLTKYPSLEALAEAPERDVAETWRPLGYNVRPRRLHAIARESVARYGGELPSDEATLRSFKGIGEYTAGAVMSFAFGKRAAILDTNVARVLFRMFVGRGDPKAHAMKKRLLHGAAAPPCVRLQPGAHGLRRHAVHRAETEMPALPHAPGLRLVSLQS
jgi:A/G-specific adenine glycosylase